MCPAAMNRDSCYKQFTYSVSDCIADRNTCLHTQNGNGFACPYNLCREPVAHFCRKNASCALIVCVFFMLLHMVAVGLSIKIHGETSETDLERKISIVDLIQIRPRRSATGRTSKDGESPRVVHLKNLGAGDFSPAHFKRNPFSINAEFAFFDPPLEEVSLDNSPSPLSSPNSLNYFFTPDKSGDNLEAEFWNVTHESSVRIHETSHSIQTRGEFPPDYTSFRVTPYRDV